MNAYSKNDFFDGDDAVLLESMTKEQLIDYINTKIYPSHQRNNRSQSPIANDGTIGFNDRSNVLDQSMMDNERAVRANSSI